MDDTRLFGEADVAVQGDGCGTAAGDGVKVVERLSSGKRKRGRPPKNLAGIMPPPPKRSKNDEEDVCFICFDGGSLVLCDRRGCPKAYHPACIKRDEAFFKSKAKWSCGWHICRTCQKASYYMCYTCTYSLCKNCSKDADYVNVRGNKGFCGTCLRTVMLIENSTLGNKEMVQVDFDDKTSWEYLFKVYWITLKEKLSLSLDELSKAKSPWKEISSLGPKGEFSSELNSHINAKRANMEKNFEELGASTSKRRKTMEQENLVESPEAERMGVANGMPESVNWGTKELLEFVAHMKNGDTSVVSCFDVQALLLEYISRSNLRDPCHKSYIVCDSKLIKLFGKPKVGHFEMFKLLDAHFITNDQSRHIDTVTRGTKATQLTVVGNSDGQPIIADDKSCKTSKKVDGQPIAVDRNIDGFVKGDDVLSDIGSRETSVPPQLLHNSCVPTKGIMTVSDDGCRNGDGDVRESGDLSEDQMENKSIKGSSKSMQDDTSGHNCGDNGSVKSKELGSQSFPCSASVDIVNSNGVQMGSHLPHCDTVKGDIYFPGQPQVSNSLKSSTVSLKACETRSHRVTDGHGVERWDHGSMDVNEGLNKTSEGQIIAQNLKQDNDRRSGKSCEQSWRPSPLKDASNGLDLHSGIISLDRALNISERNQDIDFSILTTSTSKLSYEDSKHQATKNKHSLSLNVPHQDSGPSWSTVVVTGSQLPEVAGEWGRYTSTPAKPSAEEWCSDLVPKSSLKPSAEEWCSDLVPKSSLKPSDLGSNHSAIPTSGNGQLTHSSSMDPANNATGWECSLADESVSDLLAEVEVMESLNGLPSPTSNLRSDVVLAQGSEHNCFSPVGALSPAHDPGTGDASSSRNNLQMPSHSVMFKGLFGVSQSEVIDAHTSSSWHPSTTPEMDVDTRPCNISVNKYEAGSDIQQPTASSVTTWDMAAMDTAWRPGPETTNINLGMGSVQGNANFDWDGVGQGITNVSRGTAQETLQGIRTTGEASRGI